MRLLARDLLWITAGIGMTVAPVLRAQPTPAFEVASVKPHKQGDQSFRFPEFQPRGRFMVAAPLAIIFSVAYDLPSQNSRISGGAEWLGLRDAVYGIDARADQAALAGLSEREREKKLRVMLQSLLAERFKLSLRRDLKEQPLYIPTVAKNGPELRKPALDTNAWEDPANQCHEAQVGPGRGIHGKALDMTGVTFLVSGFADRPVIDRTGLTGRYEIDGDGFRRS